MQPVAHDTSLFHARLERRPDIDAASRKTPLRLEASWAESTEELREAQRLRFQVFAGEMGARLSSVPGTPAGHDGDRFDAHCHHLLVRPVFEGEAPQEVIGTYRVLTPEAAARAGASTARPSSISIGSRRCARGWPSSAAPASTRPGAPAAPSSRCGARSASS